MSSETKRDHRFSQTQTITSQRSSSSASLARTHSIQEVHSIRGDPLRDAEDEHGAPLSRKATSIRTNATSDPQFEVDWSEDDPENPRSWSLAYKSFVIFVCSLSTWTVVLYSTVYTAAIYNIEDAFDQHNETIVTLGLTTYLVGIAVGSLVLAPISEMYGRRWVYIIATTIFAILLIPAGLTHSLSSLIILRFFIAFMAAADIANSPGTIADIIGEEYRALAFSVWSLAPMNGPVTGPLIGGFVAQYLGWRWEQWICLMLGGVSIVLLFFMRETYGPVLLQRRAAKLRKETGDERWWSRYDSKLTVGELLKKNLIRPLVMATTEPICIFWNIYIGVIYGILYLAFVAYPIVFTGNRGWSISQSGLAFIGIGIGTTAVIAMEPLFRRWINSHKPDPETGKAPLEALVRVICVASVLAPIGQFWFSWTCLPPVHWVWPILAGIPFGAGNGIVFIYATNYLARSYGIYAASAMAGNAVVRSFLGGTLPLAGPVMYASLGAHWAGTLLGFLQVIIIPVPFVFLKYGSKIRAKSSLIRQMREEELRMEVKKEKILGRNPPKEADVDIEKAILGVQFPPSARTNADELERGMQSIEQAGVAGVEANDLMVDKRIEA